MIMLFTDEGQRDLQEQCTWVNNSSWGTQETPSPIVYVLI